MRWLIRLLSIDLLTGKPIDLSPDPVVQYLRTRQVTGGPIEFDVDPSILDRPEYRKQLLRLKKLV